jgi:hypothetical protein
MVALLGNDCSPHRSQDESVSFLPRGASIVATLRSFVAFVATIVLTTHKRRWERVAVAGTPPWDWRNEKIASFIPSGSSVIDIGSGAQTLRRHLAPGCHYQPCDLIQSTPDVLVCNFNEGQFPSPDRNFTHVVCSGVLEYVRDHRRFLKEISALGETLLLSYNVRLPGITRFQRMANNWTNHFSRIELERAFTELNLNAECLYVAESGEIIYRIKSVD